jgi:hypothetical protein
MNTFPNLDDSFLPGVYRTTSWVSALVLLTLLQTMDWRLVVGFVLGAGLGVGLLKALEWSVRTAFRPEATRREKGIVLAVSVGKYAAVGLLFWLTLSRNSVNIYSLFAGFLVPQAVVFLQAVGQTALTLGPTRRRE